MATETDSYRHNSEVSSIRLTRENHVILVAVYYSWCCSKRRQIGYSNYFLEL